MLANIYLHEFDMWVDQFIAKHQRLRKGRENLKKVNPEYTFYVKELRRIKAGK